MAGYLTSNPDEWDRINKKVWKKTIYWIDDTNGISETILVPTGLRGTHLWQVETYYGSPAPSNGYDIYLKIGATDLLGAAGENRLNNAREICWPATTDIYPPIIDQNMTFVLSGNGVNNAVGSVGLYLRLA